VAQALYGAAVNVPEVTAWGLSIEDVVSTVDVWVDNFIAFNVFVALGTQWRTGGMGGATGLDYNVLPVVMRLKGIPKNEQPELFEDLQIMEQVALSTMRDNQK
jgi:hypothetical protein